MNIGATPGRFRVRKVFRVENPSLWPQYAAKRKALLEAGIPEGPLGPNLLADPTFNYDAELALKVDANEHFFFHTTDGVESIARTGFDTRHSFASRSNGSRFGVGHYFADQAIKSHSYTRRGISATSQMILARVALGRWVLLNSERHGAPFFPEIEGESIPQSKKYYDCVIAHPDHVRAVELSHTEVVINHDMQAYPELLIDYEYR